MNTWQEVGQIADDLWNKLNQAYNPGQLELFSARNMETVGSASQFAVKEAPALLRVGPARQAEAEDEESFSGCSYGGTCCDD